MHYAQRSDLTVAAHSKDQRLETTENRKVIPESQGLPVYALASRAERPHLRNGPC